VAYRGTPPLFNTSQGPALEGESRKGPPLGAPPTLPGRRSRTTGRNEAAKQGTERTGNPGQGPPTCAHPGGSQRPPFRPILDPRQVVRVAYRKTPPPFNTSQGPALEGVSRKEPPLGAPPTLRGRRGTTMLERTRQPAKERNTGRKTPPQGPVSHLRPNPLNG
jgi:hypothetical protein